MIGALRWLTYINPIRWGFESIVVNEFHTLDGTCASILPSGAGYESVSLKNQVCTTVGSVAGEATVDGNRFVALSFGYKYRNVWMNYAIVIAYAIFFIAVYWFFTERNVSSVAETSIILFKQGSKTAVLDDATGAGNVDEEDTSTVFASARFEVPANKEVEKALAEAPEMTDIFSWQHLQYVIPVGGGKEKRLLDDVSGYVVPGNLTALMVSL